MQNPYVISNFQFRHPFFDSIIHTILEKNVNLGIKDAKVWYWDSS